VFKYGTENGLLEKTVRFGSEFKKPTKKVLRLHKAKVGKKLFSADEVRKLIAASGVPLKAMILLGINAGFGNNDVGTLPLSCLNLEAGVVEFPRPKTGIERRCPLWPETVNALGEALAERPTPKQPEAEELVFVTKYGNAWAGEGLATAVSHEFGKLLAKVGIKRWGMGFYTLRHTFRTVADATRDPNAIRVVMGHTDDSIDQNYTHHISDDRLMAVTDHVRGWLFPSPLATGHTAKSINLINQTPAAEAEGGEL
jgi:integrase